MAHPEIFSSGGLMFEYHFYRFLSFQRIFKVILSANSLNLNESFFVICLLNKHKLI